ncbi:MAG: gliding motility-associated C-terminal domain-containing protein [Bacteroidetes bacterium]|nr:gliding motility-associated C-terminal domain-containing protein [Bacteroidota bacterium]
MLTAGIGLQGQNGTWTWMKGSSVNNAAGNFGIQGVPAPTNEPPALYQAAKWTDLQGNFWIFGGLTAVTAQEASALWKFDPITNNWTWVSGTTGLQQAGNYGVQSVPSPTNIPGSRSWGAATWVDTAGDLWLFGGQGWDAVGNFGVLNDLWKYSIATNEWTWMKGPNLANSAGNYGTLQVPAATNLPPPRSEACANWVSNSGELWIYGGMDGNNGTFYSDMWKYDPATNWWTCMSGNGTPNVPANFGTQQVPATTNTPGGRGTFSSWKDAQGRFWLYGGLAFPIFTMSDMWMYDPVTNLWTWMAGANFPDPPSTFQTQCQFTSAYPQGRYESRACWTDECGYFWSWGGLSLAGELEDLWVFDPLTNQFNWISGTLALSQPGNYGILQVPAATNYPQSAGGSASFQDLAGNLWMFGGGMNLGNTTNALWRYQRDPNCPVNQAINASFSPTPASGCAPLPVVFSPLSANTQVQYNWNFGDPNTTADTSNLQQPSYTFTQAGTYTVTLIVTGTPTCGPNTDTSTFVITVQSAPVVNLGSDTILCGSATLQLDAGAPASTYTWSTGATSQTITVSASGIYSVVAANGTCNDTDSVQVQVVPLPAIGNDTNICQGQTVQLNGGVGATWLWSTGDTASVITVTTPGLYWVETTTPPCVLRDSIIVQVDPVPLVNLGPDSLVCPDNVLVLDAGNPGAVFAWNTGEQTQTILPDSSGIYAVQVSLANCLASDTVNVFYLLRPGLPSELTLCGGLRLELDASVAGATAWLWNTGATTSSIVVSEPGVYTVLVTAGVCVIADTVEITGIAGEGSLYIPNTFTPNGDGNNDRFTAYGEGITDFRLLIFDRWGLLLYETTDIVNGWNGTYKGNTVQIDTYVYQIEYRSICTGGALIRQYGHVNAIR